MDLVISLADPLHPDSIAMIRSLDRAMDALYPAESNHLLDPAVLAGPDTRFVVARRGDHAVGCGAIRLGRDRTAELKRMWVDPAERGTGVGKALLAYLEELAGKEGMEFLRLETGISQPEAIGLYRRAGFLDIGPFGDYGPDPLSLFMEKAIIP